MTKILLVSDNHHNKTVLDQVYNQYHNQVDYCIHCGDSCQDIEEIEERFVCVRGNNDDYTYRNEIVLKFDNHTILVTHGTSLADFRGNKRLASYAKLNKCDAVFFGHTHIPFYKVYDGITMINPGSLSYNRDGSLPSFAIIDIDEKNISATFYRID